MHRNSYFWAPRYNYDNIIISATSISYKTEDISAIGVRVKFFFGTSYHGLCSSNELLYKWRAFSMAEAKFWPPTAPTFFLRSFWNSKIRNKSRTQNHTQNLVKIGSPGASGRIPKFWPYILGYPFLFFFAFFAQRPGHTARRMATNEAQNACFRKRKCLLGVFIVNNEK